MSLWKARALGWGIVAGLLVVLGGGCNRDNDIKVYRLAKETPPTPAPAATDMRSVAAPMPGPNQPVQPGLTWTLPEGWEEQQPGQMRVASFSVKNAGGKQADVSVIPLPGTAGGELANVNRWRGQVGLGALTAEELRRQAQQVEVADEPAELYEQAGQEPGSGEATRILAVILHRDGMAWFFKMTGDDKLVAEQKPAFVQFLKSFKFGSPEMASLPPSHPPIGNMDLSGASAMPVASASIQPEWQVPEGWQAAPAGQFLVAKFIVPGKADAQAAVNVSSSPGEGGGVSGNVNRWRQQLGLAAVPEKEVDALVHPIDSGGAKAMLVDLSGTDARTGQPARLLAAIVPRDGQTWFYKLMGDEKVVAEQKPAFTKFIQSAKY